MKFWLLTIALHWLVSAINPLDIFGGILSLQILRFDNRVQEWTPYLFPLILVLIVHAVWRGAEPRRYLIVPVILLGANLALSLYSLFHFQSYDAELAAKGQTLSRSDASRNLLLPNGAAIYPPVPLLTVNCKITLRYVTNTCVIGLDRWTFAPRRRQG